MLLRPVPSRSSWSSTVDLAGRSGERARLRLCSRRDAEVVRDTHVPDEDATVVEGTERRRRVLDSPEQDEVRPRRVRLVAERLEGGGDAVALRDDLVDHAEHDRRVTQRRERGGLRDGTQVVRQAHQTQSVHDRGVGGEVTHASSGKGECLRHRARDDQSLAPREQGDR